MERKRTENIKTFILVVLFFVTILLLYFLWTREDDLKFNVSGLLGGREIRADVPGTDSLLVPRYVAFGNGDGSYSLAAEALQELQEAALKQIRTAMDGPVPSVSEITEAQFAAALSDYPSVQIRCCVDFPGESFALHFAFANIEVFEGIPYVSSLAFSDASKESLFVSDAVNEKYYRIIFDAPGDFTAELRSAASLSSDVYYLSGSILGGDGKALIPLQAESKLDYAEYETEYTDGGRDRRIAMAQAVFGENFDFVRRLTDSFGNISYMYGYGQKVLSANTDGSFEYTANAGGGRSQGFFSDLETAVAFAAQCGGWLYDGEESGFLLSGYTVSGSGRDTVRSFDFSQVLDGVELCLESGPSLTVTVEGGQVTYLFRSAAVADGAQYSVDTFRVSDATNVVAENCNHIYNIINNNTLAAATDEALSFASDAVSSVAVAYYRSDRDLILSPCWKIETNAGVTFFFDLYTSAPLGFTR